MRLLFSRTALASSLLLTGLIASVYAPFMGSRFIRTAGDEKVYVSQAIEMARDHRWFVQTLQDEPNYYKGPLHYVLLRIGMGVFGQNPWAVLYMNFLLVLLGALAVSDITRRELPEWKGGDVLIGTAFAFGTGIYAHAFASQMEVELAGLYAIAAWFLYRLRPQQAGWGFWILTGVIGWVKSPLHSGFLGVSAVLYFLLQGELLARLKNWRAWAAVIAGIGVCLAGYLPPFLLDRQNFWDCYVVREILRKSDGSGQDWSVAVVSTFGFYLFPWVLLALVAYLQTLFSFPRFTRDKSSRKLLALGFSIFLPSVLFFIWHVYRFENYNLPVIVGVYLWLAAIWSRPGRWLVAYRAALALTSLLFLAFPVLLTVFAVHFAPLPGWWPGFLLPVVWTGCLITALGMFSFGVLKRLQRPLWLAITSAGFLWALGAVFTVIGEREMIDVRQYLAESSSHGKVVQLDYYNLNHNIWSEWGLLSFWIHHDVRGLHSPEKLKEALSRGDTILVSAKEDGVKDFKEFVSKNASDLKLRYIPWKRWRTRGQSESGKPLWQEAWEKKDLSLLEVDYFIVEPAR